MTDEPVPATGWHLRITFPADSLNGSDTVIRPDIVDTPTWEPAANAKPEAFVNIRSDAVDLDDDRLDDAEVALSADGDRLPIDSIEEAREAGSGNITLELIGASELNRRIQRDVGNEAAHLVVEDLINSETSYVADVDQPDRDEILDQTLQTATDNDGFSQWFETAIDDATIPAALSNDGSGDNFRQLQTAFTNTVDNGLDTSNIQDKETFSDSEAEGGIAASLRLGASDTIQGTVDLDYELPAEHLGIAVRCQIGADVTLDPDILVRAGDISSDGDIRARFTLSDYSSAAYTWQFATADSSSPSLGPGPEDIEILLDDDTGANNDEEGALVDGVVVYDDRYYSMDDDLDTNPSGSPIRFESPQDFAAELPVDSETTAVSLGASRLETTITSQDAGAEEAVGISGDGLTFTTATGTSAEETFPRNDPALFAQGQITLSGSGTRTGESPTTGTTPMRVTDYDVTADLANIPRLLNESYDDDLGDVLRDIADEVGSLWGVEYRPPGVETIVWTDPQQRQSDTELRPTDYNVRRDPSVILEAAIVEGSRTTREERHDGVDSGTIALEEERVITGTERVEKMGTDENGEEVVETVYEASTDYEIRGLAGEIDVLGGGSIQSGDDLRITYEFKVAGRFESSSYGGDGRLDTRASIPSLASQSACEQAARELVESQSDPRFEARVDISTIGPSQSVAESLQISGVDDSIGPWTVRDIERGEDGSRVVLGTGETVEEAINRIRAAVGQLEDRS